MVFKNILLLGTGGTGMGTHILQALIADGTFNLTVLARQSSTTTYSSAVKHVKVPDTFPHDQLVGIMLSNDIDVVISTTGFRAQSSQEKLIEAALEVGQKRPIHIIPSEWGLDNALKPNQELCPIFNDKANIAAYLDSHAKSNSNFSWTAVASGSWLDWGLDNALSFGIDPVAHRVQLWGNGGHKISCATLPYCAQATLQLLKHPEIGKNGRVFFSPFEASQLEIVEALEKVQGVKYAVENADSDKIIRDSQAKWEKEGNDDAVYTLVIAGILLPEFKSDFTSSGRKPILDEVLKGEMPTLNLDDVIRDWVAASAK